MFVFVFGVFFFALIMMTFGIKGLVGAAFIIFISEIISVSS